MKRTCKKNEGGIAIVMLMIVMAVGTLMAGYARISMNNRTLTKKAIDFQKAKMIAESAVGAGASMIYEKIQTDTFDNLNRAGLQAYLDAQTNSYVIANSGNYEVRHFKFNVLTNSSGSSFLVEISAGAINTRTQAKGAILTTYKFGGDSFLNYSIFTEGIFELFPHSMMGVHGKVRSNGPMRVGGLSASKTLTFHDSAWTASDLEILSKGKAEYLFMDMNGAPPLSFYDGKILDSFHPTWEALSARRWGLDSTGNNALVQTKAPKLNVPIGAEKVRNIIEPYDSKDSRLLQREKFSWKARENPKYNGLYITVDQYGDISVISKGNPVSFDRTTELAEVKEKSGSNGIYTLKNEGWIEVDESFRDPGEYAANKEVPRKVTVVNLYMDKLLAKYQDTDMIYVEIEDAQGRTTPYRDPDIIGTVPLTTLRIRNGHDIGGSTRGLTLATHRMVYLEGNYNAQPGAPVPALILADNLTALSNDWDDANKSVQGKTDLKDVEAGDTFYKAAFIVGGFEYSQNGKSRDVEGLQNLVRRRENWDPRGRPPSLFYYEGSYIKLWDSEETKGKAAGRLSGAPTRKYVYNPDFKRAPGVPRGIETPSLLRWKEISWDEAEKIASRKN